MKGTILLVEDNPFIMEINCEALMFEDYEALQATDGRTCMEILRERDVDLIVLDIMLPDSDGLALCREIKKTYDIPILFLSALRTDEQIIDGLHAGGDDYMPKPYDIGVLLARIEARLRGKQHRKRYAYYKGLKLDMVSLIAYCQDTDLLLTQKEFTLLLTLIQNADRNVSKEELYQDVWGAPLGTDHSAIYTTVSRLNKKLDGASAPLCVAFQRGEGYAVEDI